MFKKRIEELIDSTSRRDFINLLEDYHDFLEHFESNGYQAKKKQGRRKVKASPVLTNHLAKINEDKYVTHKQKIFNLIESKASLDELRDAYINYIYLLTEKNKSETARQLDISVRTIRKFFN